MVVRSGVIEKPLELLPVGSAKTRLVNLGAVVLRPSRVRNKSRHPVLISDLG